MRKTVAFFGLLALCLCSAAAHAERRLAFVVGIDTYGNLPADAQLKAAVRDAQTVASTLREIGFQVSLMGSVATLTNFAKEFAAFNQQIEPGDTVLFYYAGHGVAIDNQNYLILSDIPALNVGGESVVRKLALAETDLIADIQARGARVTIMVIDACRNNPFPKAGTRALGRTRGLSLNEPPEGVYALYSAGSGQEALDRLSEKDTDPNSVFTRIFVSELRKPGANLLDLGETVREEVSLLARTQKHVQVPGVYNQVIGARRIILSRLPASPVPAITDAQSFAVNAPIENSVPKGEISPEPESAKPAALAARDRGDLDGALGPPKLKPTVTVRAEPPKANPLPLPPVRTPDGAPPPGMQEPLLPVPTEPRTTKVLRFSQPQRAILLEEGIDGKAAPSSLAGEVVWRNEPSRALPATDQGDALAAAVRFAQAGLVLEITLRINDDPTLPASHLVSLAFAQSGSAGSGRTVVEVGLIQAKDGETERGSPVRGLPVRVRDDLFLIGLSSLPDDVSRNGTLLIDRPWLEIAVRYASGRRAVISFEKRGVATEIMRAALGETRRAAVRGR